MLLLQVVFLPGFGCLYIDVMYERGTLVLSLAPEGSVDTVINQQSRYACTGGDLLLLLTYVAFIIEVQEISRACCCS